MRNHILMEAAGIEPAFVKVFQMHRRSILNMTTSATSRISSALSQACYQAPRKMYNYHLSDVSSPLSHASKMQRDDPFKNTSRCG